MNGISLYFYYLINPKGIQINSNKFNNNQGSFVVLAFLFNVFGFFGFWLWIVVEHRGTGNGRAP